MPKKGTYRQQLIPFPKKLMNTTVSPLLLGNDYAKLIVNMLPSESRAGSGRKRYGSVALGNVVPEGTITWSTDFTKSDGSKQKLVYVDTGSIYLTEDDGATWTSIRSGMNTAGHVRHSVFNNNLVIVNGLDENIVWNGTEFSTFEQKMVENSAVDWVNETTVTVFSETDLSTRYKAGDIVNFKQYAYNIEVDSITLSGNDATVVCADDVHVEIGDRVFLKNIDPYNYEGEYVVKSIVSPNSPSYNNDYGDAYDNLSLGGISGTTFVVEVDSSITANGAPTAATIKCVKGESIPVLEWEEYDATNLNPQTPTYPLRFNPTGVIGGTPEFIISPNERLSGIKAYVGKYPEGGVSSMSVTLEYRKVGESVWKTGTTIEGVGTRAKRWIQIEGLDPDFYEFKFIAGFPERTISINRVELQLLKDVNIVAIGNRYVSSSIIKISSITRTGGIATVTTLTDHGLAVGDAVTVFDAAEDEYNVTGVVLATASTTTFTYNVANDPASPATVNPNVAGTMQCDINYKFRTDAILTSTYDSETQLQTLVMSDKLLPDLGDVVIEIFEYYDSPPPFSFMYTKHDRLWALSGGVIKADEYRADAETSMFLYYTDEREVLASFLNPDTQGVNFIDLSFKHEIQDELIGISSVSGSMVMLGRKRAQVWTGTNPTEEGDFSWNKTLNVSCVSGDLLQEIPNDLLFVSEHGVRQLSVAFQTEELESSSTLGDSVDSSVEQDVRTLLATDEAYRNARSFKYAKDNFYGFRFGSRMYVLVLSEFAKGWVFFNGLPKDATSFHADTKNRLIYSKDDQLYYYANGVNNTVKAYTDDGVWYSTLWFTGWFEPARGWANKRWQFITEVNPETEEMPVQLRRYRDNDAASSVTNEVVIGATLYTWDESMWDEALWDSQTERVNITDRFRADSFAIAMTSHTDKGGVEITGILALGG